MSWGDIASGRLGQTPSDVGGPGAGLAQAGQGFLQGAQVGGALMDRAAQYQNQRLQQSLEKTNVYMKGIDMVTQQPELAGTVQSMFDKVNASESNPDRHLTVDPVWAQNGQKIREANGWLATAITNPDSFTADMANHMSSNPYLGHVLTGNKNAWDVLKSIGDRNRLIGLATKGHLAIREYMGAHPELQQDPQGWNKARTAVFQDPQYSPLLEKDVAEAMGRAATPPEQVKSAEIQKASVLASMVQDGALKPEEAYSRAMKYGPEAAAALMQDPAMAAYKAGTTAGAVEKSKVMTGEEPSGQVDEAGKQVSISAVGARQAGATALAKETPSEKQQRESSATAATGHLEVAQGQLEVAQGHLAVSQDREARMKAVQEKMGATIKTFEGEAIKIAATVFPVEQNTTQHYALLQYLMNNIRGLGALAASGKSPEEIMADFTQEIARIKGEIPQVAPTPQSQTGVKHFFSRFWDSTLGSVFGKTKGDQQNAQPTPKPPLGKAARPQPRTAAEAAKPAEAANKESVMAAREAIVHGLFPGQPWEGLDQEQKQQVLDRLNGQPAEE